jgi:hypothetical protein
MERDMLGQETPQRSAHGFPSEVITTPGTLGSNFCAYVQVKFGMQQRVLDSCTLAPAVVRSEVVAGVLMFPLRQLHGEK